QGNEDRLGLDYRARHHIGIEARLGAEERDVVVLDRQVARRLDIELDPDARMLRPEPGDDGRHGVAREHRWGMQPQHARELARMGACDRLGLVDLLEDAPHAGQVRMARLGQREPTRGPLQQARAEVVLEIGHEARDDRRRHVERARRRGEAALVHDLLEHPHREETVHRDGIRSISLRGFYVAVTVPFPRGRRLVPERKFNLQPRIEGSNMTRSTSSLLALALALSAGSAMAAGTGLVNNETGQGVVAEPIVVVSKTRQQVRHELAEALHRGEVIVNNATGETLRSARPAPFGRHAEPGLTREQVRAELIEAIRNGDTIANNATLARVRDAS